MGAAQKILRTIPSGISSAEVLHIIHTKNVSASYLEALKEESQVTDDVLSSWLNINVKTFRSYRDSSSELRPDLQEQTILLLSLLKHGKVLFGSNSVFRQWLDTENFHFGGRQPVTYLNTVSGIRYVDDRLTGMEFGDNA